MRGRSSAVALLLCALVVAASAAGPLTFADWLDGASGKAGASAAPAGDYEQADTAEACLKAINYDHCANNGPTNFFQVGLGCCGSRGGDYGRKELDSVLSQPMEIGYCEFTDFPISEDGFKVLDKVYKIGSFIATCHMQEKSNQCGHPFCEKMVLSVQGNVYRIEDAILASSPDAPTLEGTCDPDSPLREEPQIIKDLKAAFPKHRRSSSSTKKVPAKAAYAHEDEDPARQPSLKKVESAIVYYGPMTVNSRLHDVKYEDGWFEFAADVDGTIKDATPADCEGKYVLDPYTFKLTFIKHHGY